MVHKLVAKICSWFCQEEDWDVEFEEYENSWEDDEWNESEEENE